MIELKSALVSSFTLKAMFILRWENYGFVLITSVAIFLNKEYLIIIHSPLLSVVCRFLKSDNPHPHQLWLGNSYCLRKVLHLTCLLVDLQWRHWPWRRKKNKIHSELIFCRLISSHLGSWIFNLRVFFKTHVTLSLHWSSFHHLVITTNIDKLNIHHPDAEY